MSAIARIKRVTNRFPKSWQWRVTEHNIQPKERLRTIFLPGVDFPYQGFLLAPKSCAELMLDELSIGGKLAALPFPLPAMLLAKRSQDFILVPKDTQLVVSIRNESERPIEMLLRLIDARDPDNVGGMS